MQFQIQNNFEVYLLESDPARILRKKNISFFAAKVPMGFNINK